MRCIGFKDSIKSLILSLQTFGSDVLNDLRVP